MQIPTNCLQSIYNSIYIYIYIKKKEQKIVGAKCKYPPTMLTKYIYIILWRSLFNLFILHD